MDKFFYHQIVKIHLECLEDGFLSSLGKNFLILFYQAIDKDSDSVLIYELKDNQVVGFISGTKNIKNVYIALIKSFPNLIISLIPNLFSIKKIIKIFNIITYHINFKEKNFDNLNIPELLTIAVIKNYRGKGISENLYKIFLHHWSEKKIHKIKILADSKLYQAHNFYLKMGAKKTSEVRVHKEKKSILFIHSL